MEADPRGVRRVKGVRVLEGVLRQWASAWPSLARTPGVTQRESRGGACCSFLLAHQGCLHLKESRN